MVVFPAYQNLFGMWFWMPLLINTMSRRWRAACIQLSLKYSIVTYLMNTLRNNIHLCINLLHNEMLISTKVGILSSTETTNKSCWLSALTMLACHKCLFLGKLPYKTHSCSNQRLKNKVFWCLRFVCFVAKHWNANDTICMHTSDE